VVVFLVLAWPSGAFSQHAAAEPTPLTDQQKTGRLLYEQSCGVCHTKPTLISGMYGPALSKESVGGQADVMREVISNGTPRMPGFKYHFKPEQIDAIVAFLKTMPAPTPDHAAPAVAPQRAPRVED
jgi:mono/diheme cytochrome c family protein